MAPAWTSLFSHVRGTKATKAKEKCTFMDLPGEVRNLIYGFYFEEDFRVEIMAKGILLERPPRPTFKLSAVPVFKFGEKHEDGKQQKTLRMARRLGHYHRGKGLQTNWAQSLCPLMLACKTIHQEVLPLLYQNTTFVFDAPSRLNNFLHAIQKKSLLDVRKLELRHATYNHPELSEHQSWRDRHCESWTLACRTAAKRLRNLAELRLYIHAIDFPLRFNLHQSWLQPMLEFRKLSRPRKSPPKHKPGELTSVLTSLKDTPSPSPKLQIVHVEFGTVKTRENTFAFNPGLQTDNKKLHSLFGKAIEGAILGMSDKVAMKDFVDAWEDEDFLYREYLGFGYPG